MGKTRKLFIPGLFRRAASRTLMLVLLAASVLLSACGASKHMIPQDLKPPVSMKKDKAVLVIVRTTSMGFAVNIENFLDGKMIGETKGKCYFITNVAPGQHYLMAHAENWATARVNFEAGRVYFLDQGIYPGFWKARTGFSPMTADEAMKEISNSGCDYRVYDAKNPGEDMSEKDFQEAKADFEKEVKEDPGRHKNILEYRGHGKL